MLVVSHSRLLFYCSNPTLLIVAQRDHSNISRFTQELRASSPLGSYFDGLLGVFYSHEADHWRFGPFFAENPTSGAIVGTWGIDNPAAAPITYNEDSVFAD